MLLPGADRTYFGLSAAANSNMSVTGQRVYVAYDDGSGVPAVEEWQVPDSRRGGGGLMLRRRRLTGLCWVMFRSSARNLCSFFGGVGGLVRHSLAGTTQEAGRASSYAAGCNSLADSIVFLIISRIFVLFYFMALEGTRMAHALSLDDLNTTLKSIGLASAII